ncbi:MAG: hypothetical protein ACOCX4_02400 [Planctomycetota bacterium]
MKKLVKWLVLAVVVLLVALAVVLTVALSGAGAAAKEVVLRYGPEVTGTEVQLDAVDVSALTGSAAVRGLVIGNPEGYKSEHAFKLGEAAVDIDVGSIFGEVVVLESVLVDGAHVIWEGSLKGSNLTKIKEHAEAYAGPSEPPEEEAPPAKVIIRRLVFRNTQVGVRASFASKDTNFSLPDVVLEDIGVEEGGATPGDVGVEVTKELVKRIALAIAEKVKSGELDGKLKDVGGAAKDGAGKAVEGLKNLIGQ